MEKSIYERIESAQQGSKTDMLYLVDKFQPLIKKYSYRLKYDDAIGDITLAFIEIMHKIQLAGFEKSSAEYTILSYIKRAIENTFFHFAQRKICCITNLEFDEGVISPLNIDKLPEFLEIKEALSILTKRQRETILLKFYYGYTDVEIGRSLSISRQAVNRIINRAFVCLKHELSV